MCGVRFRDERTCIGARKKDAGPSPLLPTPAKGRKEQYLASAPCGARHKHCFFALKSLAAQFGGIWEEAVLDARASFWLSCLPAHARQLFNLLAVVCDRRDGSSALQLWYVAYFMASSRYLRPESPADSDTFQR